jgi:hypothetical protein
MAPPPEVSVDVAVKVAFAFIVTLQARVPEHAPDHPANVDPMPAVACNVQ